MNREPLAQTSAPPSSVRSTTGLSHSSLPPPTAKLRVLHVINGEHYAGAERVQDLLAARLPELGVEVAFACVKPNRFPKFRHSRNTPLDRLPMRGRLDLRPVWKLIKLIRHGKFDLIHTHTPRAALVGRFAARLANVPMVHHVHGHTAVEVGAGWQTWLSAKVERFSVANAAAVIPVSHSAARYIHTWGVPENRIHLIPNGVPGRDSIPARSNHRNHWVLGALAMFRPRKGLEVLLQAMAVLHHRGMPVLLRVIGGFESSEYREQMLWLADELAISRLIDWRGFRSDIDAELDEVDFMVLPSVLPEGMPMAVLEAMASGVPPIGSRVEGIAEVIHHGRDGLLVEPGNVDDLANTVTAAIEGEFHWKQLAQNATRTHAAKYSDRVMAARVAEVYRQVLDLHEPH
ncbi:MAG: glycosyltransferase [Pirellulales bacterium]|nr:glycosyltransferase [Pirellulales bacterium]